ncbi:mannitol dehydrogenase family protein [Cellulophaga baltica]|uniref:mannitol dehydrogenase family protein n=1 Tax=Cellulophaga TaxID=104264 RepID=UPI001C07A7D5|nr:MULTISPECIES: mannitol dehydrogenase family protein [Cellulophaga]MBU2998195.1 mannitol dehydrogenase family protein [Cellulophaga baltica]MDO6769602.1 mannitol dehydrogenase family protein [Cellulophaga sp. 1_MG-2023]
MPDFFYLNTENINTLSENIAVPKYDRDKIQTSIIHIGVTDTHRAHQAHYLHKLIENHKELNYGICGVDLLDSDRSLYNILKDQDGLYTLMVKDSNGNHENIVIGSIIEYLYGPENPIAVIERIAKPDIKIISLTIAEDGYHLNEITGEFNINHPEIEEDSINKFNPKTVYGYLTQSFKLRKQRGLAGCTILSCDNIKSNGDTIKRSFLDYVSKNEPELLPWLEENTRFPNTMVDRITTVTDSKDINYLKKGFSTYDQWPVVCESFTDWIIEDDFLFERPNWEKVGVKFVKSIVPFENMKLHVLNAGHSILGILGTLHGYTKVHEAANDDDFIKFLEHYISNEVAPNLTTIKPEAIDTYKEELFTRYKNPYINDKLTRVCKESSTKIPIFIVPIIEKQLINNETIDCGAFIIAAWCKYNDGVDDNNISFQISDSLSNKLIRTAALSHQNPKLFLEIDSIFNNLKNEDLFVEQFTRHLNNLRNNSIKKCVQIFNANYD